MKFTLLFYFFALLTGLSCSDASRQKDQPETKIENKEHGKNKPPGSYSDTLKIETPAAVFYTPDSLQLEKIKAINDSMQVESMNHECFYQMRNSRKVLNQYYPQVKIIDLRKMRYLLFEKTGGEKECIDLDSINEPCGMIISDRKKKAELVDMTNIETQLGFYFSK